MLDDPVDSEIQDSITLLRNIDEWIENIETKDVSVVFNKGNVLLLRQISAIILQDYIQKEKGVWDGNSI